jgi:hypothetical protein
MLLEYKTRLPAAIFFFFHISSSFDFDNTIYHLMHGVSTWIKECLP